MGNSCCGCDEESDPLLNNSQRSNRRRSRSGGGGGGGGQQNANYKNVGINNTYNGSPILKQFSSAHEGEGDGRDSGVSPSSSGGEGGPQMELPVVSTLVGGVSAFKPMTYTQSLSTTTFSVMNDTEQRFLDSIIQHTSKDLIDISSHVQPEPINAELVKNKKNVYRNRQKNGFLGSSGVLLPEILTLPTSEDSISHQQQQQPHHPYSPVHPRSPHLSPHSSHPHSPHLSPHSSHPHSSSVTTTTTTTTTTTSMNSSNIGSANLFFKSIPIRLHTPSLEDLEMIRESFSTVNEAYKGMKVKDCGEVVVSFDV